MPFELQRVKLLLLFLGLLCALYGYFCIRSQLTALSKLLQEPHIVLEQQPNIVELINARAGAIDAQTESEAGEFRRVYVGGAQHIRMDHPRSAQLDPPRLFADATTAAAAIEATVIDFRAGLGERKI